MIIEVFDRIPLTSYIHNSSLKIPCVESVDCHLSGRIVHLGQNYCFIDGDLAFTRQCCVDSYVPSCGDVVTGDMMECDQGQRWKHRALTVRKHVTKPSDKSNASRGAAADLSKK